MTYVRRLCLLCLSAALFLSLLPGLAGAHAVLVASNPPNGAALKEPLPAVLIQFSEPVTAEFTPLVVRDSTGAKVDLGDATIHPRDKTVAMVSLSLLPPGFYTAVYRVTSLDGHPVQGSIAFTVGDVEAPAQAADKDPLAVPLAVSLVRGGVQLVTAVLAGLVGFLLLVWWPASRQAAANGSGLAPTSAPSLGPTTAPSLAPTDPGLGALGLLAGLLWVLGIAEVGIYAVRASGETFSLSLLAQAFLQTRVGWLSMTRMFLALAVAISPRFARQNASGLMRGLTLLPALTLLLTISLQSHAMATREVLPVLADWVHMVAAAAWVGGLVGFGLIVWPAVRRLARPDREALLSQAVPRFSKVATIAVLALAVTGLYGALLHVPSPAALTATTYGRSLLVKLGLLIPVLALGGYNLRRRGGGSFRRAVLGEIALMVGIFAAAGFLTSLPPANVQMSLMRGPFEERASAEGVTIALQIDPARIGANQPVITLTGPDGAPLAEAAVGLRVTMVTMDMGLQNLDAVEQAPGVYHSEPLILSMEGEWRVEVVMLTRQGKEIRHAFLVDVPRPGGS